MKYRIVSATDRKFGTVYMVYKYDMFVNTWKLEKKDDEPLVFSTEQKAQDYLDEYIQTHPEEWENKEVLKEIEV